MTLLDVIADRGYVEYSTIVDSWGYDVIEWVVTGSYQGDHVVLLGDGNRRAYMVIGYGSCSGCDHLEAISPWSDSGDWSEVLEYSDALRQQIDWKESPEVLANDLETWLTETDENNWYWYDDEIKQAVRGFIDKLRA